MTKKMIAGVLSVLLSSSSVPFILNASPLVSHAEAEGTSLSAETTEATATETAALEGGAALRESLEVKVGDIIYFGDTICLYDTDGNKVYVNPGDYMYLVGIDDDGQRFRVVTSKGRYSGTLHLNYEDAKDFELMTFFISHDGFVVGDLNYDGVVNVFDLCLMKRGYINGWNDPLQETLADMNDDSQVTVTDIVWLQKWLLGIPKP